MDKQPKAQYLSLSKAAKLSPYSQDYLSLRARQGKLKAVKFGGNWVTTKEWLGQYIGAVNGKEKIAIFKPLTEQLSKTEISSTESQEKNYIPLHKAAEQCGYTQEYLGLRARQGKLKAVKIGRNWLTTQLWLNDYIINFNGGGVEHLQKAEASLVNDNLVDLGQKIKEEIARIVVKKAKPLTLPSLPKWSLPKFTLPKFILPKFSFPTLPINLQRQPAVIAVGAVILVLILTGFTWRYQEQIKPLVSKTIQLTEQSTERSVAFIESQQESLLEKYNYFTDYAKQELTAGLSFVVDYSNEFINHSLKNIEQGSVVVRDGFNSLKQGSIGYTIGAKQGFGAVKSRSFEIFGHLAKNKITGQIAEAGQVFINGLESLPGLFKFYITKDTLSLGDLLQSKISGQVANSILAIDQIKQGGKVVFERVALLGNLAESANQAIANSLQAGVSSVKDSSSNLANALKQRGQTLALGLSYSRVSFKNDLALRLFKPTERLVVASFSLKDLAVNLANRITAPIKLFADFIKEIPQKIARLFRSEKTLLSEKEPTILEPPVKVESGPQQGLVVVPPTGDDLSDEALKEKIRKSFSDEVRVEIKEPDSGVIVPIFREKEGDEYLYLMVPVEQ